MIEITGLKFGKNTFSFTADGREFKNCPIIVGVRYGIKEGMKFEDGAFEEFFTECKKAEAKDYVFKTLSSNARTEKEIVNKLKEKGFTTTVIRYAINIAKEYGYISDSRYAQNYVELNQSTKGAYRIKRELAEKGVSDEIINEVTQSLEDTEEESCLYVGQKLSKGKDLSDPKNREKILRGLVARGFSYSTIKEVIRKLGVSTEDFSD